MQDSTVLAQLVSLTSLSVLSLGGNQLQGNLVPILTGLGARRAGDSSDLIFLNLNGNQLSGEIPEGLTELGIWQRLFISGTGPAPAVLNVRGNMLEGEVPAELLDPTTPPPGSIVQVRPSGDQLPSL